MVRTGRGRASWSFETTSTRRWTVAPTGARSLSLSWKGDISHSQRIITWYSTGGPRVPGPLGLDKFCFRSGTELFGCRILPSVRPVVTLVLMLPSSLSVALPSSPFLEERVQLPQSFGKSQNSFFTLCQSTPSLFHKVASVAVHASTPPASPYDGGVGRGRLPLRANVSPRRTPRPRTSHLVQPTVVI